MYDEVRKSPSQCDVFLTKAKVWSKFVELSYRLGLIQMPSEFLKAVYMLYTIVVHNFDLQEKTTSTLNNNQLCYKI